MRIVLSAVMSLMATAPAAGGELQMLAFSVLREGSPALDWLLVLLAGLLGVALWSSAGVRAQALAWGRYGLKAQNLFIGVRMQVVGGQAGSAGPAGAAYLRSLTLREASLVSADPLAKGDRLELELGCLPGHTALPRSIRAQVIGRRRLCAASSTYLVTLRLEPRAEDEVPLALYLRTLNRRVAGNAG